MAYIGDELNGKPLPNNLDWSRTEVVLVSGDFWNPCGHVLLFVGGGFGHYFQYATVSVYGFATYIDSEANYKRFLFENKKVEFSRKRLTIPEPKKAEERLTKLMHNRWAYGLFVHNCATFTEEVVKAGGNFWDFPDACPRAGMNMRGWLDKVFGPSVVNNVLRMGAIQNAY
jgi:hypothetical protein